MAERNVLEHWLGMHGYDIDITPPLKLYDCNLDKKAIQLITVLTYPKVEITESDLVFLKNFWKNKTNEFTLLYKLCNSMLLSDFKVVPVIGYHVNIQNITYLATNEGEQLKLKMILIPESLVLDTVKLNLLVRSYHTFLNEIPLIVKCHIEDNRKQPEPQLIFVEKSDWVPFFNKIFDEGYLIGEVLLSLDAILFKIGDNIVVTSADPTVKSEQEFHKSKIGDVGLLVNIVSSNFYKRDVKKTLLDIKREYVKNTNTI